MILAPAKPTTAKVISHREPHPPRPQLGIDKSWRPQAAKIGRAAPRQSLLAGRAHRSSLARHNVRSSQCNWLLWRLESEPEPLPPRPPEQQPQLASPARIDRPMMSCLPVGTVGMDRARDRLMRFSDNRSVGGRHYLHTGSGPPANESGSCMRWLYFQGAS